MPERNSRRTFLQAATGGALLGVSGLDIAARLPRVAAAEAQVRPGAVRLRPEIEPLVAFLEETPRERIVDETIARIRQGASYQDLLAALLLAGVRNVEPRPAVGFKFHAVLVVNSAHLASLAAPERERWLPLVWAIDHFKGAQAQNVAERDGWRMPPVDEAAVPPPHRAREAFVAALDRWDAAAADAATAGLVRSAGAGEVFELFARYAPRDFRSIGHKAIFLANAWRTLATIGWQHSEPVLRSLAYALLAHDGGNPAQRDDPADRAGRANRELARALRPDWRDGRADSAATAELLGALRTASDLEAARAAADVLARGIAPRSVWDALFDSSGEVLMRRPGIIGLHAVTTVNALRYLFETAGDDATRRWILLQAASFTATFREESLRREGTTLDVRIDGLEPQPLDSPQQAVAEICQDISAQPLLAARKVLAYVREHPDPRPLLDAWRLLVFAKGNDAHDYKFSAAVLEDFYHVSPAWRDRYLAASVFNLTGSQAPDNVLMQRAKAALT